MAQTEAATAQQKLSSATGKIATEQQAVAAAQGRVAAQRAAIAQTKERQSYALLASPITGVVLEKVSEPGNLIQPGGEVLRLADFSSVKVVVPVSELELSSIRVGQSVQVRLDAFPKEEITGKVTRISPAADATARQLPVEITEGVVQVYSQTREGQVSLDLFFQPGGDIDQALNDATAAFNRGQSNLPDIIEQPRLFKVDPSQLPVYELALRSPSLPSSLSLIIILVGRAIKYILSLTKITLP